MKLSSTCVLRRALLAAGTLAWMGVAHPTPATAQTNTWEGTASPPVQSWFDPTKWSLGIEPGPTNDVFVGNGRTATIQSDINLTATASNLTVVGSSAVTVGLIDPGTLVVEDTINLGTDGTAGTLTLNGGSISFNTLIVGSTGTYSDSASGVVILTGEDPTIKMQINKTVTINSEIQGTNGLIKDGLGTLVLANNNTYSGGTTISLGTLQVGNGGTTGDLGSGDVTNNAALVFNRSNTLTVDNLITGTGTLTKNGGGILILTADNDYSGLTTINTGTLQIGDGGTTGSLGTGFVLANAALVFNRSDDIVVANQISGTGSLTQTGVGTLTLTGTNTYSGLTTISAGTLQVGDGSTTGTLGTGNVVANGSLVFNRSDDIIVSNQVSGTGSFTHDGSGLLTLAGNNTYSGVTIVTNGTLQVGNGSTTGSIGTGATTNDATIVFNRSNALTVSSSIAGTGMVMQAGGGTTVLTGTNTYTGVTVITNGTLQVGNGSTTGTLGTGDVLNDATLAFNRSNTLVVSNDISGTGAVSQSGSGTTILVGANTYSGVTTIGAGTLQIGDGGTTGTLGTGAVTNQGNLVFAHSDDFAVTNAIAGTGSLAQAGSGTLILTGTNTYSGTTTITNGVLQIGDGGTTGTLGSGATVNQTTLVFDRSDTLTVSSAISGTGTVVQAGGGTTILTGNNTLTGLTTITNGTLQVGNGGTTGSLGSGAVSNGTALVFNRSNTLTVSSAITGTGTVMQAGSGTTILTGTDTYGGATIITNGLLQVGNGGSTGTLGTGDVLNDAALGFSRNNTLLVSNNISGTGAVSQFGSGTTILVGTNTYSGVTEVVNGTLQIGDGGTSGTLGSGAVTNDAALVFNRSDDLTISNQVAGSGRLTQAGSGTLILTGTNTYSGATIVTNGVLQVGDGGTTGTLGTGNVTNNTTLVFNRSDTNIVANVLAGTGTVIQGGSGITVLTGANTYSGVTSITNGTLQVGNGGLSGSLGSGTVSNDAALVFNRTTFLLVANSIAGTGTVMQAGTDLLILTGTNTYSGATIITNGFLLVGNGGSTGTLGTGDVLNDAALGFSRNNTLLVSNNISGTGAVSQFGSGTTILVGTNTYSGVTTVEDGTLQIGDGGTSGTLGSGAVTNDAALVFNRSDDLTISNQVAGSGRLTQAGSGTLILTGTNTYSGATIVTNGVLQVGDGGTTGTLGTGNVTNNTTLVFNRSDTNIVANVLAGTGTVIQGGSGITILTSNNTYSGVTLITNGTLQVGNGGATGTFGAGTVTNDAALVFNRSNNQTVGNTIAGTGTVTQAGSNFLILTGTNTYSGATIITNGFLLVGNGGSTGTLGTGDVLNDAALGFSRNNTLLVSNNISGAGTVSKFGSGTTILVGSNTYSGVTEVVNGTLQIGDGGTAGTLGTGAVTNDANLVFAHSDDVTVTNAIAGTGRLAQAGTGTLTLLATNTYSGATIITNGTLQVGDGGLTGTLGSGVVSNSSALVFNRSNTNFVSNLITGTGTVTQAGSGVTVFTTNQTYSGLTIITNGTLQVGNGGTTGSLGSGVVSNDATLAFNRSNGLSVGNVISGSGNLIHAGTGNLIVTATNTFSGGTTVSNGGTLFVRNAQSLGTGNVNLLNGGLQMDSLAPLALHVGGDYTQGADGVLQLALGGTASNQVDRLTIDGMATLDGTLRLVPLGGFEPQSNDEIILLNAAGGVTGEFASFTNTLVYSAMLRPELLYGATDVTVRWTQLTFLTHAVTPNQRDVAANLDLVALSNEPTATNLVAFLNTLTDPDDLRLAYDLIAPEELSAVFLVAFADAAAQGNQFLNRVSALRAGSRGLTASGLRPYDPDAPVAIPHAAPGGWRNAAPTTDASMFSPAPDNPWGVYIEGVYGTATVDGDDNADGYDVNSMGFNVGLDRRVNDRLVLGGSAGYVSGEADLTNDGSVDVDSVRGQVYAVWLGNRFHVEGLLGLGFNSYDTSRQGLLGIATGDTSGVEWHGQLSGGYDWQHGGWTVGPVAVLQYISASIDAFTETGSLAPLKIDSQTVDSLQTRLGVRVGYEHEFETVRLQVGGSLAWQHEHGDDALPLDARMADGSGGVFTVDGPALGRDSVAIGLGFTVHWTKTFATYFNYSTELGRDGYQPHQLNGGLGFSF